MPTAFKAYELAKGWTRSGKTILCITADEKSARRFKDDLEFFSSGLSKGEVCLFPPPDVIPYLHLTPQSDIWIDRLRILHKLTLNETVAIVAPIQSVMRLCPPSWIFQKYRRTIHLHDRLALPELTLWLTEAGYINQPLTEDEGSFSVRGGIIDIFTPTMDRPVRCELDGDAVASIRTFDPSTQRSSFSINSFTIIPVKNVILNDETKSGAINKLKELSDACGIKPGERRDLVEQLKHGFYSSAIDTLMPIFYEKTVFIKDYLPADTGVYLENALDISAEAKKLNDKLLDAYASSKHIEKIVPPQWLYDLDAAITSSAAELREAYKVPHLPPLTARPGLNEAVQHIKQCQQNALLVIITCHTTTQADRILDILRWNGIPSEVSEKAFAEVSSLGRSNVWIMLGRLSGGLVSETDGLAILTDEEIFGSKVAKRPVAAMPLESFTDFSQLTSGDYVIHKAHGLGRYLGLQNLEINKTKNDFLILQYLGGDKLYLPIWHINLISRHIGAGGEGHVALDRLGGTRWSRTQKKVTASIRTMAMELLKIYASRKSHAGFSFSPRDHLLEEFEAAFPYDETPDQLKTIEETLVGMQADQPSDRLICGDVGYGKTEVAMRAAFKAVSDGKQAAILVPTTVLAFQHYENFLARFEKWPVRIEMLSRFRTRSEQKHIVDELARGMVNIVIGTHRLLQRDVKFHDLGLLLIDEEHRFGVAHKERIRRLRTTVDTITMSATPIPRTLHMSFSGIRDISIINTPPANRLSIRTYVAEFEEGLIRGAIMAELMRGGQVFFVHNRVETIGRMHELLSRLVPEAKVIVGHGQMNEHDLEDVMIKFLEKKANILLCTTIIESGLDIPSANTIIINRADTMGLAQLYQLRGRVGRSNVQAYAYLLTPSHSGGSRNPVCSHEIPASTGITSTAQKRLALLQRYTELGSGFQIAMHDLEIRGAGNILGAQQSGHINAIGYEMYVELLEKAIRHLQGRPDIQKIDVEISLPIPAYIPETYIADQGQRLVIYRRLASIEAVNSLDEIAKELADRFGPIAELVRNLLKIVEIRIMAKGLCIESIQFDGKVFAYKFNSATPVRPETILRLVQKEPQKFTLKGQSTIIVNSPAKGTDEICRAIKSHLQGFI